MQTHTYSMCIYIYTGAMSPLEYWAQAVLVCWWGRARRRGLRVTSFFQFPELGDGFLLMFVGVTNRVTLWLFNIAMENPL